MIREKNIKTALSQGYLILNQKFNKEKDISLDSYEQKLKKKERNLK